MGENDIMIAEIPIAENVAGLSQGALDARSGPTSQEAVNPVSIATNTRGQ